MKPEEYKYFEGKDAARYEAIDVLMAIKQLKYDDGHPNAVNAMLEMAYDFYGHLLIDELISKYFPELSI